MLVQQPIAPPTDLDPYDIDGIIEAQGVLVDALMDEEAAVELEYDDTMSLASHETVSVARCWSFLMRNIRSGLVADAIPHVDDDEVLVGARGALDDRGRSLSIRLRPQRRSPTQEWTLIASSHQPDSDPLKSDDIEEQEAGAFGRWSRAPKVQLVNPSMQLRLACERERVGSTQGLLSTSDASLHRVVVIDAASMMTATACEGSQDPYWMISGDGAIVSSWSGLALTDDGEGNLSLQPLAHPTSAGQQWQLIPIL
jgi:hypothetical protein